MLRRSLLLLLLLTILLLPSLGAAQAGVQFAPRLAYGSDPRTEMTIVWNAPAKSSGHRLEYGLTPDLGTEIKAIQRDLGTARTWPVYARVSGLEPGSEYYYQVRMGEQSGPVHRFRTAPNESAGFSFLAWGDQGSPGASEAAGDHPARVLELANRTEAEFVLAVGDLAYAGTNESHWDRFTSMITPLAARRPFMTVPGNHDLDGGSLAYRTRFRMPAEEDVRWYAFRYGNAFFIGLDTESFCNPIRSGSGAAPYAGDCEQGIHEAQRAFLRERLAGARADPAVDWVIAYHHYPVHSVGKHGGHPLLQRHWAPLYEEFGVDLVVTAHDHLYVRTHPLAQGAKHDSGVTYVTVGTGGARLYEQRSSPEWVAKAQDDAHGVLRVQVGAAELRGEFISINGDVLDPFVVQNAVGGVQGAPASPSFVGGGGAWMGLMALLPAVLALRRAKKL